MLTVFIDAFPRWWPGSARVPIPFGTPGVQTSPFRKPPTLLVGDSPPCNPLELQEYEPWRNTSSGAPRVFLRGSTSFSLGHGDTPHMMPDKLYRPR